jgi:deoxyribose-phosphate aldolase
LKKISMLKIFDSYDQIPSSLEERIGKILDVPDSDKEFRSSLIKIAGVIDLTTLEGSDTEQKVTRLCHQARFSSVNAELPDAAAVCVYPSLVKTAATALQGSGIRVASVAGAFPSGQTGLHIKLEEINYAIGEGADEIDTVISRGKLIGGKETEVFDEISAMKDTCGRVHLKVILETGELNSVELIRRASELAILGGADFIKTSTGKIPAGASLPAFLIMLDTIREYLEKTGKSIGIKPAGGIRTPEQAIAFARLLTAVLGEQWLCKDYFRIGASSLADEILRIFSHPG